MQTKKSIELQSIETDCQAVKELLRKSQSSTGMDSRGNELRKGDEVRTLTRGKYYERIAKVTVVKADNHIDYQYLVSKASTWRKGYNILKIHD